MPGSSRHVAELERLHHEAAGALDHRARALNLADRRLAQLAAAAASLAGQAGEDVRVAAQALDRPGERGGGRLVAGDEQRQQLVGDLGVRHRLAALVPGLHEQREHVVALLEAGVGARGVDQRVDVGVELAAHAQEASPGAPGAEVAVQRRCDRPGASRA